MISFSVESQLAAQLNRAANEIEQAQEKALDRVAEVALNAKVREVQKTYQRPIPRSSTGRPLWKRTGNFLRGQSITKSRLQRDIGPTNDSQKYEPRLARLNTERRNEAAKNAADKIEPQVMPVFEQELKNALRI